MPVHAGGLRAAGRKAANALRSTNHHSTNGQVGGGGTARAIHLAAPIHGGHVPLSVGQTIVHTLEQIRPRNPPHKLFTSTRNFITTVFTRLSAPGIRVPANIPHTSRTATSKALHTGFTRTSIQSGLSLPVRYGLHTKAFGAGTFLPRAPVAPRPNIVTNVGLGAARNFSSGRPIFQNIVDNVPIALRALYEADLDVDFARKKRVGRRPLYTAINTPKRTTTGGKMKSIRSNVQKVPSVVEEKENVVVDPGVEFEQYFCAPAAPAVTTYVFVPLAPTPTNRLPLSTRDALPSSHFDTGHFIPISEIGGIHASHSRHTLRVSTLFARLDQANVWSHPGVSCAPYSGCPRKAPPLSGASSPQSLTDDEDDLLEGVCTFLKLEFAGWTLAEVRGVIGESGQGWCVFEEVWHKTSRDGKGLLSEDEDDDAVYLSSAYSSPPTASSVELDPAQSMVMPTLDFSSSFLGQNAFATEEPTRVPGKALEYEDPWMDEDFDGRSSVSGSMLSRSSSFSSFGRPEGLDMIIDPPSENGWFTIARGEVSPTSVSRMDDGPLDTVF